MFGVLSLKWLFVLITTLEVIVACVIVWYVGYHNTSNTYDDITNSLRQATQLYAASQVGTVINRPIIGAQELQRVVASRGFPLRNRTIQQETVLLQDCVGVMRLLRGLTRVGVGFADGSLISASQASTTAHGVEVEQLFYYVSNAQTGYNLLRVASPENNDTATAATVASTLSIQTADTASYHEASSFYVLPDAQTLDNAISDGCSAPPCGQSFGPYNSTDDATWRYALGLGAQQSWYLQQTNTSNDAVVLIAGFGGQPPTQNLTYVPTGPMQFVVSCSISPAAISAFLAGLPNIDRGATACLVSNSGTTLASSLNSTAIGGPVWGNADPFFASIGDTLNSTVFFVQHPMPSAQFDVAVHGTKYIMTVTVIDNGIDGFLWVLALFTPTSIYTSGADSSNRNTLILSAVVVVVSTIITFFASYMIYRPIMQVIRFMQQLTENDGDAPTGMGRRLSRLAAQWTTRGTHYHRNPRSCCLDCMRCRVSCFELWSCSEVRKMQQAFGEMISRLSDSHRHMEQANAAKRLFLRFVFHEVRVPLNAVSLAIDHLKFLVVDSPSVSVRSLTRTIQRQSISISSPTSQNKVMSPDQQKYETRETISVIQEQVAVVTRILNDVLSMQRIEDGELRLEVAEFCVEKMVLQTVNSFIPEFTQKQLTVTVALGEVMVLTPFVDLSMRQWSLAVRRGMGGINHWYHGDQYRLRQVIGNLLSNAVKFTPAHGTLEVTLHLLPTHPSTTVMELSVRDSGVGMTQEDQQALFRPYSQLTPGELQEGRGSGLGLNIARRLATLHGGDLTLVQSEVGHGTTFKLSVPLEVSANVELPAAPHLDNNTITPVPGHTARAIRVLVVEDSLPNRKLLLTLLRSLGYEVRGLENGAQAVELYRTGEWPFSVVLMDNFMPVMTGIEATRQLRSDRFQGPIIGVTGNALEEDQQSFIDAGANSVLSKPVTKQKLQHAILAYIS